MSAVAVVLILVSLLALVFAAAWWVSAGLLVAERTATRHWAAFGLSLGSSVLVVALAARLGLDLLFPLANALFLLGIWFAYRGLLRFLGLPPRDGFALAVLIPALVVIALSAPGGEGLGVRVTAFSLAAAALTVQTLLSTRRRLRSEFGSTTSRAVQALLLTWLAVLFLARGGVAAFAPGRLGHDVTQPTTVNLLTASALALLLTLFNLTLAYLVIARLVGRLQFQSERDPLTGMHNRRALEAALQREWQRWKRHGHGYAAMVIDIDHFKRLNDEHGHATGDAALREIAARMATAARAGDTLARTGGEEFCVLMPDTSLDGALAAAQRMRAAVRTAAIVHPGAALPLTVTVSIGVALTQAAHRDPYDVIVAADEALYRAKEEGRDRICSPPPA